MQENELTISQIVDKLNDRRIPTKEIVEKTGLHVGTINNARHGKNITSATMKKLCDFYAEREK